MSETKTISEEIIKKSNTTITVIDDLERSIVIRKPKYSHYLNLVKALGADLAKNSTYVELVGIVCALVSIDGEQMPMNSLVEINHIINKLEKSDNALAIIAEAVSANFTEFKTVTEYSEAVKK